MRVTCEVCEMFRKKNQCFSVSVQVSTYDRKTIEMVHFTAANYASIYARACNVTRKFQRQHGSVVPLKFVVVPYVPTKRAQK